MPINSIDGEFSSTMFILNLGNKYQDWNSLKDTECHYSMWSIMFILKYVCIRCAQHCILLRLRFPLKTDMWLSIDVTRSTTTQATMPLSWQLSFVCSTVFSHPSFIFILLVLLKVVLLFSRFCKVCFSDVWGFFVCAFVFTGMWITQVSSFIHKKLKKKHCIVGFVFMLKH